MTTLLIYSRASVYFLQEKTNASSDDCQKALQVSTGDLMAAWRQLDAASPIRKFHDRYTFGPFERIVNPERDLPRCRPDSMFTFHCEATKNHRGDKSIAPFGDANSISDIHGVILWAALYPNSWDDRQRFEIPTIQGRLMEISDRIRDKLVRNRSNLRSEMFAHAFQCVEQAKDAYFDGNFESGKELLFQADKLLAQGNKLR